MTIQIGSALCPRHGFRGQRMDIGKRICNDSKQQRSIEPS